MNTLALSAHLILSQGHRGWTINRVSQRPPALSPGEVAVRVTLNVDRAVLNRPAYQVTADIGPTDVTQPDLVVEEPA